MDNFHKNDIALSDITSKFILDFETYLSNHIPKDQQKPLYNNGIMKHIEKPRKMTNLAVIAELAEQRSFQQL